MTYSKYSKLQKYVSEQEGLDILEKLVGEPVPEWLRKEISRHVPVFLRPAGGNHDGGFFSLDKRLIEKAEKEKITKRIPGGRFVISRQDGELPSVILTASELPYPLEWHSEFGIGFSSKIGRARHFWFCWDSWERGLSTFTDQSTELVERVVRPADIIRLAEKLNNQADDMQDEIALSREQIAVPYSGEGSAAKIRPASGGESPMPDLEPQEETPKNASLLTIYALKHLIFKIKENSNQAWIIGQILDDFESLRGLGKKSLEMNLASANDLAKERGIKVRK